MSDASELEDEIVGDTPENAQKDPELTDASGEQADRDMESVEDTTPPVVA